MERYKSTGRDSGVAAYEIGSDYVRVQFSSTSRTYTYSYRRTVSSHVEEMKLLARSGSGLNAYINKHVKNLYDR